MLEFQVINNQQNGKFIWIRSASDLVGVQRTQVLSVQPAITLQQRRVLCMPFQARALHKLPCRQLYEPKHSARAGSGGTSSPMPSSTATSQPWYSANTPTSRGLALRAQSSSSTSIACTRRYFMESGRSISITTLIVQHIRKPGYPLTSSDNAGQSLGRPDRLSILFFIQGDCIRRSGFFSVTGTRQSIMEPGYHLFISKLISCSA
ncbi:uncharacterized protein [Littorina saxatilis]|uniref:uncharacterized protein n=1 Tax=Littorina saxatilis TaxID=31220 RepID=UPI0038B49C57